MADSGNQMVLESVRSRGRVAFSGIAAEWPCMRSVFSSRLWAAAVIMFGVGDILTTLMGFSVGAVEENTVTAGILGNAAAGVSLETFLTLFALKLVAFGIALAVWAYFPVETFGMPERWRAAVPASLTVFGVAVVAYNLRIIYTLAF